MITAQVEPWSEFVKDAVELFPAHWEELALNKDKVPLSVQHDVYLLLFCVFYTEAAD